MIDLTNMLDQAYNQGMTNETQTIARARCDGHDGYRNGRKHLVDLDRLFNAHTKPIGARNAVYATGPCPVCGVGGVDGFGQHGPAAMTSAYTLVDVKGTKVESTKCRAACLQSASAECKCSCGGADHGMYA